MNYRKLPKGNELINPLGIGLGAIQVLNEDEIEKIINKAINCGINFFDLCGGGSNVYRPFGKAIKNRRDKVYFELHFGAVYDDAGEYGFSRDLNKIKETFKWEMEMLQTDYAGSIHRVRAPILSKLHRRIPAAQHMGNPVGIQKAHNHLLQLIHRQIFPGSTGIIESVFPDIIQNTLRQERTGTAENQQPPHLWEEIWITGFFTSSTTAPFASISAFFASMAAASPLSPR